MNNNSLKQDIEFLYNIEIILHKNIIDLMSLDKENRKNTDEYLKIFNFYINNIRIEENIIERLKRYNVDFLKDFKFNETEFYSCSRILETKDLINKRIYSKLNLYEKVNPYFLKDIYNYFIGLIEKEINKDIDNEYKEFLLKIKYNLIYINPLVEKDLLKFKLDAKDLYLDATTYTNDSFITYKSLINLLNANSYNLLYNVLMETSNFTNSDLSINLYKNVAKINALFIRACLIYYNKKDIEKLLNDFKYEDLVIIFDKQEHDTSLKIVEESINESIRDKKDIKIFSLKPITQD